jgi:hypothetical protein
VIVCYALLVLIAGARARRAPPLVGFQRGSASGQDSRRDLVHNVPFCRWGGAGRLGSAGGLRSPSGCRPPGAERGQRERTRVRLSKKTTSRAAIAPAAKLGDSQMMSFMGFSLAVGHRAPARSGAWRWVARGRRLLDANRNE